jgi:hypothetical protein
VRASKIVKRHPGTDAGPRLAAIGVGFQMHLFILDGAPQPFDEDVVHEAAASVHRNRDAPAAASLPAKASAVKVSPDRY